MPMSNVQALPQKMLVRLSLAKAAQTKQHALQDKLKLIPLFKLLKKN